VDVETDSVAAECSCNTQCCAGPGKGIEYDSRVRGRSAFALTEARGLGKSEGEFTEISAKHILGFGCEPLNMSGVLAGPLDAGALPGIRDAGCLDCGDVLIALAGLRGKLHRSPRLRSIAIQVAAASPEPRARSSALHAYLGRTTEADRAFYEFLGERG